MSHRLVDTYFQGIPVPFIVKYQEWFKIWAVHMHDWGPICSFPLHNGHGRVLIDVSELDDHGNPPFIVVRLKAQFDGAHMLISPNTAHDADLIERHSATLRS